MARRITSTAASFDGSDGAKPPSSPWPVAWPSSWRIARSAQKTSEPGPQRVGEGLDADRHDHELLEVGRVLGVLAAVEDVEHRDRQRRRARPRRGSGRAAGRTTAAAACAQASETPRIAFAPSAPLFGVPSSSHRSASMPAWSAASRPYRAGADRVGHVGDRAEHALAAEPRPCRRRAARPPRGRRSRRRTAPPRGRPSRRPGRRRPRPSGCRASRGSRARRRPR